MFSKRDFTVMVDGLALGMFTTRRQLLAIAGAGFAGMLRPECLPGAASLPGASAPGAAEAAFDVDRLLRGGSALGAKGYLTRYTCGATVTFFSIPIVSRANVGSGYAAVEESLDERAGTNTVSIQFGAGSWPEAARGLNRLGFIQEAAAEDAPETRGKPGRTRECAYVAFMTTSQEKTLEQAKQARDFGGSAAATVPYTAAQGLGRPGRFESRVDRLEFPSKYGWRDVLSLTAQARTAMAANTAPRNQFRAPNAEEPPATFLYALRRAALDEGGRTRGNLCFNGKRFQLETVKEADETATEHFREKKLTEGDRPVIRMSAVLTGPAGEKTPFRVWYQAGCEHMAPLRFEYQARSFLRLTFEADPAANVPPVRYALARPKENA